MKLKKVIIAIAVAVATIACAIFPACKPADSLESTERINNPDQGFYRPIFVKATESGVAYNKNIVNNSTQVYHLRVDISAFSKAVNGQADAQLSQPVLDGLEGLLAYLKERDKNAIVRFAYDPYYEGKKDKEPALDMILKHVGQVCPLLNSYENTVTALEVGLIGPWGEMHSSAIANKENITPIVKAFLDNTQNIAVLVRTPKMIYDYLGITVNDIDDYKIDKSNKAYRLGLFNDGYLGSGNDLGTYSDREREIEFLSKQTDHLPYGGEVVIPGSKLHDIETCLPEMHKINLSYLNVEWNNQVIDKWKNSTYTRDCGDDAHYYGKSAFTYIENRMGYRFVLSGSTVNRPDDNGEMEIAINLKNVGFGNLNKVKKTKVVFTDENGQVAASCNLGSFIGEETFGGKIKPNLKSGKYDVYLRVYGEETDGVPYYCIQFANDGIWNADLKANKLGTVEI